MRPTPLAVFGVLLMGAPSLGGTPRLVGPSSQAPPSALERIEERRGMVEMQIAHPRDGRAAVTDSRVLEAMLAVPRHVFVPAAVSDQAYDDTPLPIGHGQTISQPYIVALMTEHLRLPPRGRVLEIGTGSGYQAAVLAHLTPNVYTIEIVEALARAASQTLRNQGYGTVQVRRSDGHLGWPEQAPFDAIIVTCAPEAVPEPLWNQLKPGGRIVIPIGPVDRVQRLVVVSKTPDGERRTQAVTDVRFVPMIRMPSPPESFSAINSR
jgi:protein-L-isoaspartate(D-aspartate) O-methyltransferase